MAAICCVTSRRSPDSPPSRPGEQAARAPARAEEPAERRRAQPQPGGVAHAAADVRALLVSVVLADGSAASGARVALMEAPCTEQFPRSPEVAETTTDSTGAVELDWRGEETVLYAWTSDHAGVALLGDVERKARKCSVTLRPAPAVTVVVVDSAGRPIEGATVTGCARPSGASVHLPEFSASRAGTPWGPRPLIAVAKTTDGRGTCLIPPLPEGDVDVDDLQRMLVDAPCVRREVWVEMRGYRSERRALDAPTVRVQLVEATDVHALLTDDEGRSIANAEWRSSANDHGFGSDDGHVLAVVPSTASPITLTFDADGFVPRDVVLDGAATAAAGNGSRIVDLGTVVLRRAVMLTGAVWWPDGSPAAGVLVTADAPSRRVVQDLTNAVGRFSLEPPEPGDYRVSAGTVRGRMLGSLRPLDHYWEAVAERVTPGADTRLELRHVPAVLVEFVGPDPRPQGFHWSNVVVVARSADGRTDYDYLPEDFSGHRRVIYLYGTPPWTLVAKHAALEPVEVDLGSPVLGPDDPLPVHKLELRAR